MDIWKKLGIGPGSILEWDESDGEIVVRRAGRYSSEDIHRALFARKPKARALEQLKEGIRQHLRQRYAKR